mmetsp:Transcript_24963/g.58055  ORF Transcript_24963/g.58055 Transcript_24963/m.58055 type:complete len:242 (-) Transcript_24963:397-1122(-)
MGQGHHLLCLGPTRPQATQGHSSLSPPTSMPITLTGFEHVRFVSVTGTQSSTSVLGITSIANQCFAHQWTFGSAWIQRRCWLRTSRLRPSARSPLRMGRPQWRSWQQPPGCQPQRQQQKLRRQRMGQGRLWKQRNRQQTLPLPAVLIRSLRGQRSHRQWTLQLHATLMRSPRAQRSQDQVKLRQFLGLVGCKGTDAPRHCGTCHRRHLRRASRGLSPTTLSVPSATNLLAPPYSCLATWTG